MLFVLRGTEVKASQAGSMFRCKGNKCACVQLNVHSQKQGANGRFPEMPGVMPRTKWGHMECAVRECVTLCPRASSAYVLSRGCDDGRNVS